MDLLKAGQLVLIVLLDLICLLCLVGTFCAWWKSDESKKFIFTRWVRLTIWCLALGNAVVLTVCIARESEPGQWSRSRELDERQD